MSAIKHAFHEVIGDEYGAIEALEAEYHMAFRGHESLHARLPVYRTPEQEAQLRIAYNAMAYAKWKLDQARDWKAYKKRTQQTEEN